LAIRTFAISGLLGGTFGAIVGLADVDTITISPIRMTPTPLTAVACDTVTKIGIGIAIGRERFAAQFTLVAAACIVAGAVALLVTLPRS